MRYTLTLTERQYQTATSHLFSTPGTEQALYLLCGISHTDGEARLLARSVIPVQPQEVLSQSSGHVSIPSSSFLPVLKRAEQEKSCFVFVHSHPEDVPDHSAQDDREEIHLFRTAYNRINAPGAIHASLVFSRPDLPRGRVWLDGSGTAPVDVVRVVGDRFRFFFRRNPEGADTTFHDRQVRAFGPDLLPLLKNLTVGIVGAGGTGSAVTEQLIRLGVGHLTISDGETLDPSNVSRVYGSGAEDGGALKVELMRRLSDQIGLGTEIEILDKPITFASVLKRLRDCDLIFGCTDDEWGRALLSRFCLEYLIPVFDLGAKIDSHEGTIRSIVGRVTVLLPGARCLFCRKQISAVGVQAQMMQELRPEEAEARRKEGYAPELGDPAPAVVAFTTATAALAVTELLQRLVGFRGDDGSIDETIIRFDHGEIHTPGCMPLPDCFCLDSRVIGRGDRARFLDQAWRPE